MRASGKKTPNTNPMGHWIRFVLLRFLELSQHFSFHGCALLWGRKQAVCTRRLSYWTTPFAPFSRLASPCYVDPSWFAQLGPVHGLRKRTPSLSEHQNHLRNVNFSFGVPPQECSCRVSTTAFPRRVWWFARFGQATLGSNTQHNPHLVLLCPGCTLASPDKL